MSHPPARTIEPRRMAFVVACAAFLMLFIKCMAPETRLVPPEPQRTVIVLPTATTFQFQTPTPTAQAAEKLPTRTGTATPTLTFTPLPTSTVTSTPDRPPIQRG